MWSSSSFAPDKCWFQFCLSKSFHLRNWVIVTRKHMPAVCQENAGYNISSEDCHCSHLEAGAAKATVNRFLFWVNSSTLSLSWWILMAHFDQKNIKSSQSKARQLLTWYYERFLIWPAHGQMHFKQINIDCMVERWCRHINHHVWPPRPPDGNALYNAPCVVLTYSLCTVLACFLCIFEFL